MSSYNATLEKQKLQEAFKHLDKDKDGHVTYDEIVTALKNEGVKNLDKVNKKMVKKFNKGISVEEFCDIISR